MQWDLGLRGLGLLVVMAVVAGMLTQLIWRRKSPIWLWAVASIGYLAFGLFVSEVWFGWATEEELQPNVDGLSFDEVLMLGMVVPLVVLSVIRLIGHRRATRG